MRREDYERSYGRRGHMPPPPRMPSPQEDPRSRRSRTKMKCLISIGLILPALAAVIGVAAWAVSADVVMSSGGNGRTGKPENSMMQNFLDSDNRRDIFRANHDNQMPRAEARSTDPTSTPSSTTTKQPTTKSTTTTTTTTTAAPVTLSPQEETDVNAILSKLISASGAATGGGGPRFVVVAPLPDNPSDTPAISRADSVPSTNPSAREDTWHVSGTKRSEPEPDLPSYQKLQGRSVPNSNASSRVTSNRRMSSKNYMVGIPNNNGFNNPHIDLTGFEPFDSMMHDLQASQSTQKASPHFSPPGSFGQKRGPPQSHSRNQHPMEQHLFHHIPDHAIKATAPQGLMAHPPPGLKPIQQQMHHIDPMRPEESNRWGTVGFHPGPPSGGYVHKPPEGISLSISSPANSGTHVSSEPVSVIKSFFLPFLPKPRLNMNARVVFGVVLDKGMGLGGDKKSAGRPPFH